MVVYFNESFIEDQEAHVPITTHALHYGTGCFEGIRAYYNKSKRSLFAFRIEDHYRRLLRSCAVLSISLPHSIEELCQITVELLQKNFMAKDLYIRPLAYKKDRAIGNFNLHQLADGFFIYTVPLGRHFANQSALRIMTSSWRRVSQHAIPPQAKITGSYVNTCLAKTEATKMNFDEALFLNEDRVVVEGSAENLFMVKGNVLTTPPVSDGILEGVTRDTTMKLSQDVLGLHVEKRSIPPHELYEADEVFLVGTGAEIGAVSEIDGKTIGDGKGGKVTKKLKECYHQLVHGQYDRYTEYLTEIKEP